MPNLNVVIPSSLANILNDAVVSRGSSLDSVVTAALSQYFQTTRHRAYQISTSAALVQGIYDGAVSSRTLLANGDFGLGTFEHLDGEMVVLDGNIYQVRGNGSVQHRPDDFLVPFAVVSRFQPDESFDVPAVGSLEDLERACDHHRESDNLFFAFRVDGVFERMHTRAMKATSEGTGLAAAAQTEPEFHFEEIVGTLVSIWSPRYSTSFSVPGYHFHFISEDRTKGGHVLGCSATKVLRVGIQVLCEYDVRLPAIESFLKANLAVDTTKDLRQAE
ncbi:MAG: alpha-acetolactate decarboxylase [Acidobacteriaceae bacterium]|nr:alpha-acetolactate decarboxylase [Acidobacteriaceae bacterium]